MYYRVDPRKQTVCFLRCGIAGEEDFIQVGVDPTDACILVKGGETHHPQKVYNILGGRKK